MEYLTIKQVAERLQVSTKTISRRIDDGSLPCVRLGAKTIRIDEKDLDRYLAARKVHEGGDAAATHGQADVSWEGS